MKSQFFFPVIEGRMAFSARFFASSRGIIAVRCTTGARTSARRSSSACLAIFCSR